MSDDKTKKDIKKIMDSMNKEFKEDDSKIRIGDEKVNVKTYTTGSIAVDDAIGVGGLPVGRIVEIYGPESSGKTTMTLCAIAAAQKEGKICAFIDAEHALDPQLAKGCGVVWDDLLFYQPNYGEKALLMAEKFLENGVDIIVIDSVAALIPRQEYEGEIDGKDAPGAQGRMMSKGLRKLTGVINKCEGTLIFVNQIREKIGVMFGNPETTPGGRSLKFSATLRIEVKRIASITQGKDNQIGNKLRVTIVKNKLAIPYKKAEVDLIFGKGVDNTKDLIQKAVEYGIVEKKGSTWYVYKDYKVNGAESFIEVMRENGLIEEIENKTREIMVTVTKPSIVPTEKEDDFDE